MQVCFERVVYFLVFLFALVLCGEFDGPCRTNKLCLCTKTRFSCYLVDLMSMPVWAEWSVNGRHLDFTEAPSFQMLTESALDGLQLWTLTIAHTSLQTIEIGAFTHVAKTMYSLDLRKNSLQHFPFRQLGILEKLGALYIDDNEIVSFVDENFHDGDWGHLKTTLFSLSLSGNFISHISEHSLSKLVSLKELNLARNRIKIIEKDALPNSLVYLQMDDNIMNDVPQVSKDLKILHLAKNLIKNIKLDTNVSFYFLDLSSNNYVKSKESVLFCAKQLKIDFNKLKNVPKFDSKCKVDKLSLRHNEIERIEDDELVTFVHLKSLSLDYNKLKRLPANTTLLSNLKILQLSYNNFVKAPHMPSNIEHLSLAGNFLNSIPVFQKQNMYEIRTVDLSYNLISHIRPEDFNEWCEHLKEINLEGNLISNLDEKTFKLAPNLQIIKLNYNSISFFSEAVLTESIKELELSYNLLTDFNYSRREETTKLNSLILDGNSLSDIDFLSPTHFNYLEMISFNNNKLKRLNTSNYSEQKYLTVVSASFNQISDIYELINMSCGNVKQLDLSFNAIVNISKRTFSMLKSIEEINLDHNLIINIDDGVFENLSKLRLINLANNELYKFSFDWFMNVAFDTNEALVVNASWSKIKIIFGKTNSKIANLDLSRNKIKLIPERSFTSVGNSLLELNLAFNSIRELNARGFEGLKYLQKLDLSNNLISVIKSKAFSDLENLQMLLLKNNFLSYFGTELFWGQHKLKILDLENNTLSTLPKDLFKNTMIEKLVLKYNSLPFYPASALQQIGFTLKYLDLSYNKIDLLEQSMFLNTPFLQSLILRNNKLFFLHQICFIGLQNLKLLDLGENNLNYDLKDIILNGLEIKELYFENMGIEKFSSISLPNLTVLSLGFNKLNFVERNCFQHFWNLRKLYLHNNELQYIHPDSWKNNKYLLYLDLSHNQLLDLDLNAFQHLPHIVWLNLKGIPFSLDEEILGNVTTLKTLKIDCCNNWELNDTRFVNVLDSINELEINVTDEKLDSRLMSVEFPKLSSIKITGYTLKEITNDSLVALRAETLRISIAYTSVESLPSNFFANLQRIPNVYIDISDNSIEVLDPISFYPNKTMWNHFGTKLINGGFKSMNNNMKCDCKIWWFAAWISRWQLESGGGRNSEKMFEVTCTDENNQQIPLIKAVHTRISNGSTECDEETNSANFHKTYITYFVVVLLTFKVCILVVSFW